MTPPAIPEGPYRVQEELSPAGQSYFVVVGPDIDWPGGDETLAQGLNVAYAAGLAAEREKALEDVAWMIEELGNDDLAKAIRSLKAKGKSWG